MKNNENNSKRKRKNKSVSKVYFEEGQNYPIPRKSIVKLTDYKSRIEVKHSWRKPNNLKDYKKHDKNHCINLRTGELKEYSKNEKYKSKKDIRNSMNRLREMILFNFQGNKNELFITLTCEEYITEIEVIKKYKKYFVRDLNKKFLKCKFEYIYKWEKMKNNKWHLHMLLKDDNHKTLYIDNDVIESIWKRGGTKTKRVYK